MRSGDRRRRPGGRVRGTGRLPRLVIAGASGRLGRVLMRKALEEGFPLIGAIGRSDPAHPIGPIPPPTASRRSLENSLRAADVYLTATTPQAERANLPRAADAGVPAVVATTGLGPPRPDWLRRCARSIPIVADANFSLGMAILRTAIRSIGPLPEGFDVSIVESHRRDKVDHPSGTARSIAIDLGGSRVRGWQEASGRRRRGTVEIASLRGGDTPGTHLLQIAGRHELLRFEHVAYGREAFADGMLLAAQWLHREGRGRTPGFYSLQDVLGEGVA